MPATLNPAEDHGTVLASRALAARLREQVEEQANLHPVQISLSGVETVSPSFADELFAKLDPQLLESGRVSFIDVHPDVDAITKTVMGRRSQNGLRD